MLIYGKYECFVMQRLYVWVFCASCGRNQFCVMYEEAYSRAGLMTASYVTQSASFCLPHPVAVSAFIMWSGFFACTEML